MATAVDVPQFGNTVEECVIARWVRQKGDIVSAGDVIADIETDKTVFEITAPVDGTLLEMFFEEGALVPVFTTVCVIGTAGESVDAFIPGAAAGSRSAEALRHAPEERDAEALRHTSGKQPEGVAAWSPRARKFAAERGYQPSSIVGTGPGGRVIERDVRKALGSGVTSTPAARPAPAHAGASGTRATIARRMRESLASTAQYTLHSSAGAAGLLAVRARLEASSDTAGITINDLVAFCTIQALLAAPHVNAELIDGRIVPHAEVHLGFACDTPRGLTAPVVRNAHALSIQELAARMKDLAARAVRGTISPDDLSGATFTISNLGSLGIETFTPVLNPPQVAILGIGAIHVRPVRARGGVEFIDAIGLSLTLDHQVIDGAPGARFLQVLREKVERVEEIVAK